MGRVHNGRRQVDELLKGITAGLWIYVSTTRTFHFLCTLEFEQKTLHYSGHHYPRKNALRIIRYMLRVRFRKHYLSAWNEFSLLCWWHTAIFIPETRRDHFYIILDFYIWSQIIANYFIFKFTILPVWCCQLKFSLSFDVCMCMNQGWLTSQRQEPHFFHCAGAWTSNLCFPVPNRLNYHLPTNTVISLKVYLYMGHSWMVTKQEKRATNLSFDSVGIYKLKKKKSVVLSNEWQMICIKELQITI